MSTVEAGKCSSSVLERFFDSIATRYDFINDLLSLKLDHYWRIRARNLLITGQESEILDLGTGTGKFLKLFCEAKTWDRAVGLDFSSEMLGKARVHLPSPVEFIQGDFLKLPFSDGAFDLVVSAYALRSVSDLPAFFNGIHRVLKSTGTVGILCLTRPPSRFWRAVCYPYLKYYLPWVGGLLSGNREAYHFLSESILHFQEPEKTAELMLNCGFQSVKIHRMTVGLATLLIGKK